MSKTRERLEVPPTPRKNSYFTSPKDHIQFVHTGCALLDCALGGGWALGRIVNVVGDKSTSKTGLSTEALINFCQQYPKGQAAYRDIEAAFDEPYAQAMGLPLSKIDFGNPKKPLRTVEAFHDDLKEFVEKQIKAEAPGIYVLDSLDALSDEGELERDITDASYGGAKPKKLSELFRRLTPVIESSKVLLLVVSQVRDNIGAMFGEKHKRSGGKALDFYASQIVWLSHMKTHKKTIHKVERAYGIQVKFNVKKNKVTMPFRQAEFPFIFGFGIDDIRAGVEWLEEVGRLKHLDPELKSAKDYLVGLEELNDVEYNNERQHLAGIVADNWTEIENDFLPRRRKYEEV